MIGKVSRGRRVPWLLAYLYGPGRRNEHVNPHTIAGFDDPDWLDPPARPDGSRNTAPLAELLEQPLRVYRRDTGRPVWHCSVRAAPADRQLTDQEWAAVAEEVVHRTGLARRGEDGGCRWIAMRHADDHIHIVVTLARQDGAPVRLHNDYYRVGEACAAAEYELGLTAAPRPDRTGVRRPSRGETERARREDRPRPAREVLRQRVQAAAAGAGSAEEFLARLRREGLLLRLRNSQTSPGEVTGYAVALPGYHATDGQPVWFGGGTLAADLSLPRLRRRWGGPGQQPARARLAGSVREAAEHCLGVEGLAERLRSSGLLVRLRESRLHPGQVSGYAVADPAAAGGGRLVWFAGSALASDLSLPRLRRRWAEPGQPARARLAAAARDAAAGCCDVEGFAERLRRGGLLVRLRESQQYPGQASGYAVADPGHVGADGQPVWFAGGALAPDLSLPRLRRRWLTTPRPGPPRRPDPSTAARRTGAAADRVRYIQAAARRAGEAAEQMRRAATGDDPAAAAAAHAAADVYTAAARVLDGRSGGAMTEAADAFARAARERWGIVAAGTPASAGIRQAARGLLVVGRLASTGEAAAMAALVLQLASVADALAGLRRAQARAAQSTAARRAAESAAAHQARLAGVLPVPVPAPVPQPHPPAPAPRRSPRR